MSQLKKGAILSYATIVLTNVVGLILTPYIIRKLGTSEYGLYALIGAFVGYISVLDFGLNNTVIRFVAKYRANRDEAGEQNFLATTFVIYFFISAVVAIVGAVVYFNIDRIYGDSLTFDELEKAKVMIILLIFNLAISLPGGAFNGICSGYERFVFPRTVNIIRYIIRSLLVFIVLYYGGKAISIVVIDTSVNVLIIAINMIYVLRFLKVKIKLKAIEKESVKTIFNYSIWIFVFAMIGELFWRSGQMVLGKTQDTNVVAIYAVAIVLSGYFGAFAGAINGVFLPKATFMVENNSSRKELTDMFVKIGRILTFSLLFIYIGFVLYGKQFITLWVGETYEDAYLISVIVMTGYILPLVQNFANSMIEATGKFKFKAKVYFITISIGIVLGAILSQYYSYWAIAWCYSSFWVLAQVIMNWYFHTQLNVDMKRFFKETFGEMFLAVFLMLGIGYGIEWLLSGIGWINLGIKIILFSVLYLITAYFLALNDYEKALFFRIHKK